MASNASNGAFPVEATCPIVGLEASTQTEAVLLLSLERPPAIHKNMFLELRPPVQLPRARRWNLCSHDWNHWKGPEIKVSMTPTRLVPC